MNVFDWINILSLVVLVSFVVALIMLIVLLYRANRVLYKIDHLSGTFKGFVQDLVPAIVNMGTIATAVQSVLRVLVEHLGEEKKKK